MKVATCPICQDVRGKLVDSLLDGGIDAKTIQRTLIEQFEEATTRRIVRHRGHYSQRAITGDEVWVTLPDGTKKLMLVEEATTHDIRVLVRDSVIDAIEDGRLEPTDDNWSTGVGPGLRAQDLIDKADSRTTEQQLAMVIARALMGGGTRAGFLAPAGLIEDGIDEGEYEDLTDAGDKP